MQVVVEWENTQKPLTNHFVSTHITNWIDPDETSAISDQKINVVGTLGRFQADQKNRGLQTVIDSKGINDLNPYFCSSWTDPKTNNLTFQGYGIKSVMQFLEDVQCVKNKNGNVEDFITNRPSF